MTEIQENINTVAPLRNVVAMVVLIERVKNRAHNLPGLARFYGPSGWGKSSAAIYATIRFNAVTVQVKSVWTQKTLCAAILAEVGMPPEPTVSRMLDQISPHLALTGLPLLIDAADFLVQRQMIEIVRDIDEGSGAPVILIGEELLPQKLRPWERVHGRILDWVAAQPGDLTDLGHLARIYAPGIGFGLRGDLDCAGLGFGCHRGQCAKCRPDQVVRAADVGHDPLSGAGRSADAYLPRLARQGQTLCRPQCPARHDVPRLYPLPAQQGRTRMKSPVSTRGTGRWTEAQMLRLAASGVAKVDLLGERGTTLCSRRDRRHGRRHRFVRHPATRACSGPHGRSNPHRGATDMTDDTADFWKGLIPDGKGGLTPVDLVKPQHLLEDEVVRKIACHATQLSAQVARFKEHRFDDIGGFEALLAQEYGSTLGGAKGNKTLMSVDGPLQGHCSSRRSHRLWPRAADRQVAGR